MSLDANCKNMKTDTTDTSDCYGYMRLTHLLAVCWGLPIIRRRMNDNDDHDKDTVVQGHVYAFDRRAVPVWLAFAALNAFVAHRNYREASGYVGASFKSCFEESYCVAVIELANRNVGPASVLACLALHGRAHKAAALAGTERALAFLRDTDAAAAAAEAAAADRPSAAAAAAEAAAADRPSAAMAYYSAALMAAYAACIWLYAAAVPPATVAPHCVNALTQTAVYNLVLFHYYVLERGHARVNRLLEAGARGAAAARSLARLADAYDDLGRLADRVNCAYAPGLMVLWPYNVVRLIMVVLRVIELSSAARAGNAFARTAAVLIVEHVVEVLLFLFHLSNFCAVGGRLAEQARRTSASLQKFKLIHSESHLDLEVKKMFKIFWIRVNARQVRATVGGFIIVNLNLMKAICSVIATYFLVLIQFEYQKGTSKPLHHLWN